MASKYRYYIGAVEVFPTNDKSIRYDFKRASESSIGFEKTLETELVFNYESGSFNFKTQETDDKCVELEFTVTKLCGGLYTDWFKGKFSISEGEFDDYKCKYTIKPKPSGFIFQDVEVNILQTPFSVLEGAVNGIEVTDYGYRNYTQAKYFDRVLLYVAQKSNPAIIGVISNFFQINPTAAFPLAVTNNYQYMAFAAISDIQEPIPSNLATKSIVTFKGLMDDLKTLFYVDWYIDSNNNLRIEHGTFFDGATGLNLVGNKYLLGKKEYSYDGNETPREEIWSSIGHSQTAKLTYSGLSKVGKNTNSKSYNTRYISTDYYQRFYNGSSEKGIFLFATNGGIATGGVWRMLDDAFGHQYLNPGNLVKDLHTYKRPSLYAIFNAYDSSNLFNETGGIILDSVAPIKKQVDVTFPVCCNDDFDPADTVLTDLGVGYVDKASLDTNGDMLTLSLKYEAPNCDDFLPSDLNGLQLWLKYNEGITQSGGLVSQWSDASGNGRHMVQTTAGNKPSFTGSNTIKFLGDEFLFVPAAFQLFPAKRGTVICLFRSVGQASSTAANGFSILSNDNGGAGPFFDLSSNIYYNYISTAFGNYPQNWILTTASAFGQAGLFIINRNEDTYIETRHNSLEPISNPVTVPNTQPVSSVLILGDNPNNLGASDCDFEVYEIIAYDYSLTQEQMEKIEYYFIKKGIYFTHKY